MRPLQDVVLISLLVLGGWLLSTNDARIFPTRNVLQYHLLHGWWGVMGYPESVGKGTVTGTLRDGESEQALANSVVLATRWDGTSAHTRSDAQGQFTLSDVPTGYYVLVAEPDGYEPSIFGTLTVRDGQSATVDGTFTPLPEEQNDPFAELPDTLAFDEGSGLHCEQPIVSDAGRQRFTIRPDQNPDTPFYLYTPLTEISGVDHPVLLTLYPGPAEGWECVSVPLAAAGYTVIAFGTQHRLDLEEDVDLLKELLAHLRAGRFTNKHADGERVAVLGGSYSALHAQRLLADETDLDAGILLGAPTDLFDMRRRFEHEGFIPPFGLDQAVRALGFPDREPLRYWDYSAAYHVRADMPPLLLVHSRADDIVPYPQSTLLAEQLDAVGVPHELHFFDGASHYLLEGDSDALEIYELTLRFLDEHLPAGADLIE